MNWIELAGTAVALAMDAFAVAMCRGLEMKKLNVKHLFLIAFMFGLFQALMPLIGYWVSFWLKQYIEPVDHWIAFALLAFIGIKMIAEAVKGGDEKKEEEGALHFKMLLLMSFATSIDALVVGITFVATGTDVWVGCAVIGVITFALSALGVLLGNKVGARFSGKAEIFGGAVLILIGLKILLDHLGVLPF